ncbi:MAG: alpha/beta hydrolase, partial [Betaproteobacteria bacterium]|nr:alpha/beta hydrolase [Betaproteobacteria bacterium]
AGRCETLLLDAGHFIPEELPDSTATALRQFLSAR